MIKTISSLVLAGLIVSCAALAEQPKAPKCFDLGGYFARFFQGEPGTTSLRLVPVNLVVTDREPVSREYLTKFYEDLFADEDELENVLTKEIAAWGATSGAMTQTGCKSFQWDSKTVLDIVEFTESYLLLKDSKRGRIVEVTYRIDSDEVYVTGQGEEYTAKLGRKSETHSYKTAGIFRVAKTQPQTETLAPEFAEALRNHFGIQTISPSNTVTMRDLRHIQAQIRKALVELETELDRQEQEDDEE